MNLHFLLPFCNPPTSVGKSALIWALVRGIVCDQSEYQPTIGITSFTFRGITVCHSLSFLPRCASHRASLSPLPHPNVPTVQIQEFAGDERFREGMKWYIRPTTAMLLVADASNMDSVADLQRNYDLALESLAFRVSVVLNKIDRADPAVQQAVEQFAARHDLPVIAVSAATLAGVEQLGAFLSEIRALCDSVDSPVPSTVAPLH